MAHPRLVRCARGAAVLAGAMFARPAVPQAVQAPPRPPGAEVHGVVYDSVARRPLRTAVVQLVAAQPGGSFSQSVIADSTGRFVIADVPDGRYTIGFLHPMLDSLGIEPPVSEVIVTGSLPVNASLAIPSPARLRAAICAPSAPADGTGDSAAVMIGFARRAPDSAPVAGATVTAEWLEVSIGTNRVANSTTRRSATAAPSGWFALCGLPRDGALAVVASRDADSSGRVEVQVPADHFLRRDIWLGAARVVTVGGTASRTDSLAPPRRIHVGDGRLSGRVTSSDRQPIADARVSIADGPEARTDARGEWALTGAPPGSRMLIIRGVSYYPERRAVDVLPDAPRIAVTLSTLAAVLDTVHVVGARKTISADLGGFEERRRSGMGTYLTPKDIARRPLLFVSQVFRMTPFVSFENDSIKVRGTWGFCTPALYVDGMYVPGVSGLTGTDIDMWVTPDEVAGIEVYHEWVPPQFQPPMSGCGSIVIWTRPRERRGPLNLRRSLLVGSALVAVMVLSLTLIR